MKELGSFKIHSQEVYIKNVTLVAMGGVMSIGIHRPEAKDNLFFKSREFYNELMEVDCDK